LKTVLDACFVLAHTLPAHKQLELVVLLDADRAPGFFLVVLPFLAAREQSLSSAFSR
jgi:hypothetical protein